MQRRIYRRLIAFIALCAIAAIIIWPHTSKKTNIRSMGENVSSNNSMDSEIQRLTLETNEQRDTAEKWDTWNIRFVFLAGFAAVCLAIAAIGVSKSNRALLRSSDELSRARDSKLALDLRTKDGEIAHAQELAGKANQRAEELAQENLEIKGTINRSVAETLLREEELKAKNLETESRLGEEHRKRLELEKSLAPRHLEFIKYTDGTTNVDSLKELIGTEIVIETIPDFEARQAAGNIYSILKNAGLNIVKTQITENFVWDGVSVDPYRPAQQTDEEINRYFKSSRRRQILEEFLYDNGWQIAFGDSQPGELKPDMVRIRVGYKPNPYFAPPELREVQERMMQADRRVTPIPQKDKRVAVRYLPARSFPVKPE